MQQILKISTSISSSATSYTKSAALASRGKMLIDRISAFLVPTASAAGALPTRDVVEVAESGVSVRIWRDINQQDALTPSAIPICALQSREMGPVPVQPFEIGVNDQPTIEWSVNSQNLFLNSAFTTGSDMTLVVCFFAVDSRA